MLISDDVNKAWPISGVLDYGVEMLWLRLKPKGAVK